MQQKHHIMDNGKKANHSYDITIRKIIILGIIG